MSAVSIGILAFSMSVDAFIAALGRGAAARRPGMLRALKTGAVFGIVEAATPLIGWTLGRAASRHIEAWDHWIAFGLLSAVGLHMAREALRPGAERPSPSSFRTTLLTAIGTSVDAMAVGVSLAFLEVNILLVALVIGLTTMAMSTAGLLAGHLLGRGFGRIAGVAGGIALAGIGAAILSGHLAGG